MVTKARYQISLALKKEEMERVSKALADGKAKSIVDIFRKGIKASERGN